MEKYDEKYNYLKDRKFDYKAMRDKKPTRELYTARVTRLSRSQKSDGYNEDVHLSNHSQSLSGSVSGLMRDKSELLSNTSNEQDDDKPRKNKLKRPDQLIYVPKARAAALAGLDKESPPKLSSSSKDKEMDSVSLVDTDNEGSCSPLTIHNVDKKEPPKNSKRYSVSVMRNRTVSCSSDGSGSTPFKSNISNADIRRNSTNSVSPSSSSSSPQDNVPSQECKKQYSLLEHHKNPPRNSIRHQDPVNSHKGQDHIRHTKFTENIQKFTNNHKLENYKNSVNNKKFPISSDFQRRPIFSDNFKIIPQDSRKYQRYPDSQKFDRRTPEKRYSCKYNSLYPTTMGRSHINEKWGDNLEEICYNKPYKSRGKEINDFGKTDHKHNKISCGKFTIWKENTSKPEQFNIGDKSVKRHSTEFKPIKSEGTYNPEHRLKNGIPSPLHYWDDDDEDTIIPTTVIVNKKFANTQEDAQKKEIAENKKIEPDLKSVKNEEKKDQDHFTKAGREKQKNVENLRRDNQGILNYSTQEMANDKVRESGIDQASPKEKRENLRREKFRDVNRQDKELNTERNKCDQLDGHSEFSKEKKIVGSNTSYKGRERRPSKPDVSRNSLSEHNFTKDWSDDVVVEETTDSIHRDNGIINGRKSISKNLYSHTKQNQQPTKAIRPEGEFDTHRKFEVNVDRGPEAHSPKGGGIIRLTPDTMPHRKSESQHTAPDPRESRSRNTRNVGHWHLYDPQNVHESPPPPLKFHDPESFSPHPYYDRASESDFRAGKPYQVPSHRYANYPGAHYSEDYYYSPYVGGDQYHDHSGYYVGDQDNPTNLISNTTLMIDGTLRDIISMETLLSNILSRRLHGEESMTKIKQLRQEIQLKFVEAIFMDISYCNDKNVEQAMWKSAFYQVIEAFRRQLGDGEDTIYLKEQLLQFLDEAIAFYEEMLDKLQKTYGFVLADYLDSEALRPEGIRRSVKLALLSAQRCMISLGDIARYREQTNETSNYGKARSWYMKAQQIAPKNGRPYNQLAILALYTKRKLDAVYFYTRSLAASNPFLTARESLMSLFDDARKKAEHGEKKRLAEHYAQMAKKELRLKRHNERREIWVSPDGTTSEQRLPDSEEEDEDTYLSKLNPVELNKRFVISFLNCHGKLFTKIGMETFPEISSGLLREFHALIQHYPMPLSSLRLLQLMAVNMFAVENTASKGALLEENSRPLLQEQALQLGLDMYGLLVERCNELFKEHLASPKYSGQLLSEDLQHIFPSIKVWSDWMMCHKELLNPPPAQHHPSLGPNIDVWCSVAELINILYDIDQSPFGLHDTKEENDETVILPEDTMLAGFVPLLSISPPVLYVAASVDKELARDCLRIKRLLFFADCWCGIDPPLLTFQVDSKKFVPVVTSQISGSSSKTPSDCESESDRLDNVVVEYNGVDEADSREDETNGGNEIKHLKLRKEELIKKRAQQEQHKKQYQAMLKEQRTCPVEIEIQPSFLVPDTNCFIDHLVHIRSLLESKKFVIVIPLIVINELDGLAKGSREGQYDSVDHAQMVVSGAKQAMSYLEECFSVKDSHIRALTSKGSILETIAFRSEDTECSNGNNDDLILACCLHYCKDQATEPAKEGPIHLHRDVVLLTDDRNLRLKAHTLNVPVRNVPAFLRWLHSG